jgi:hypothetical protein
MEGILNNQKTNLAESIPLGEISTKFCPRHASGESHALRQRHKCQITKIVCYK